MLNKEDLKATTEPKTRTAEKISEPGSQITQDFFALMEAKFQPQFDLLLEGQRAIFEALAPKSRVEALEDEVGALKSVVACHSEEVSKFRKAN